MSYSDQQRQDITNVSLFDNYMISYSDKERQPDINFSHSDLELTENTYDVCIVGAGLSGVVLAERHANCLNHSVLIIEKRSHIAGNCYDYKEPVSGLLVNLYGAHLFHTNDEYIWQYVNRFSKWRRYDHRVLANIYERYVSIPVNIETVNILLGLNLKDSDEFNDWIQSVRIPCDGPCADSASEARSRVGDELYMLLFRNYTIKQWGRLPETLDAEVTARIPIYSSFDTRYFQDRYQALPYDGYTQFVQNILDSQMRKIDVILNSDYFDVKHELKCKFTYFTGPIDRYYSFQLGSLEYRSLKFHMEVVREQGFRLPAAVVNFPTLSSPHTRIVEYKHFLQHHISDFSVLITETSSDEGEPYYPVPSPRNRNLYAQYQALAKANDSDVVFVGRLANYKYFNMDAAIANALKIFNFERIRWSPYRDIIIEQIKANTDFDFHMDATHMESTIGFVVRQNRITETRPGIGFIHTDRVNQHRKFIEDVLAKYKIRDMTININLDDHPKKHMFNFCRDWGQHDQLLIPNSRFALDDVVVDEKGARFQTFDSEVAFIRNYDTIPYDVKIQQVYTSSVPHSSKIDYFVYAAQHSDCCTCDVYIGPPHNTLHLSETDLTSLTIAKLTLNESQVPFLKHANYRYVLYNDGNSLSDRMRLLLVLNSLIIRKPSEFEEIYTRYLRKDVHFIQYDSVNELQSIVNRLNSWNVSQSSKMLNEKRKFVNDYLSYEVLIDYFALLLQHLDHK